MTLIKVNFELHRNSPDSTSISVRRLIKIWETSARCTCVIRVSALLSGAGSVGLKGTGAGVLKCYYNALQWFSKLEKS